MLRGNIQASSFCKVASKTKRTRFKNLSSGILLHPHQLFQGFPAGLAMLERSLQLSVKKILHVVWFHKSLRYDNTVSSEMLKNNGGERAKSKSRERMKTGILKWAIGEYNSISLQLYSAFIYNILQWVQNACFAIYLSHHLKHFWT